MTCLQRTSVAELTDDANQLTVSDFVSLHGPMVLLSQPSKSELERAAYRLRLSATAPGVKAPKHVDDLLLMLYGFRTLLASFMSPAWVGQIVTVGRDSGCGVFIDHSSVSERHASLEWMGRVLTLRDEKSTNGTFINGEQLLDRAVALANGDVIGLGECSWSSFTLLTASPTGCVRQYR